MKNLSTKFQYFQRPSKIDQWSWVAIAVDYSVTQRWMNLKIG